jgi:hypothetical protein
MPILIANVVNGPDSAKDDNWAAVINRASSAGKTVLGYVRTGYLGVSQQKFVTRLGVRRFGRLDCSDRRRHRYVVYPLRERDGGYLF